MQQKIELNKWVRPLYLSKRKKKEIYQMLGGKYNLWDRIKLNGIGVGGMYIDPKTNEGLPLLYPNASERTIFTLEKYKSGLLIGINNTKEIWWLPTLSKNFQYEWFKNENHQKEIQLKIDEHTFIISIDKWNIDQSLAFFDQLCTPSHIINS